MLLVILLKIVFLDLSNVEIISLPPNTTSCMQPMNVELIASLKRRYRRVQVENSLRLSIQTLMKCTKLISREIEMSEGYL